MLQCHGIRSVRGVVMPVSMLTTSFPLTRPPPSPIVHPCRLAELCLSAAHVRQCSSSLCTVGQGWRKKVHDNTENNVLHVSLVLPPHASCARV
eukprot:1720962-Rhodomonas_salina.1